MTKQILYSSLVLSLSLSIISNKAFAQVLRDSSGRRIEVSPTPVKNVDSAMAAAHSPKIAAIRSAIVPGWGQAYNKKYWKIPIVYAGLGTAAYIFRYNLQWYNRFRYAYKVTATNDTSNFGNVYYQLQPFVTSGNTSYLQFQRNEFRRYIDYSVIAFILLWGLNVVDATVDAHLKSFDVSPDLSLQLKPGYSELANTHGISLVLAIK